MKHYNYEDLIALIGVGAAHPGGMALTREILSRLAIDGNTEVLEVGCGTGKTASYLAKYYGCKVTAVEKNPVMLRRAAHRFREDNVNVRLLEGYAEKLPFSGQCFELVLVESVTIFTDIPQALREYFRVLRPGGILVDLEMTSEVPLNTWMLRDFANVYGIKSVPTQRDWLAMLSLNGFDSLSVLGGGSMAFPNHNSSFIASGSDFDPAPLMNSELYDIYARHLQLQMYYSSIIGYRIYLSRRPWNR